MFVYLFAVLLWFLAGVCLKVNKRYSTVLFGFLMSLGMSFSMSLVLSVVNLGGFFLIDGLMPLLLVLL